jgi:hypothetical protein
MPVKYQVSCKAKIKDSASVFPREMYKCTKMFLMLFKYQVSRKAKIKDSASEFPDEVYTAVSNAS